MDDVLCVRLRRHRNFQLSPLAITRLISRIVADCVMFTDFPSDFVHDFAALVRIDWKVRVRACDFGHLLEFLPCLAGRTYFRWVARHTSIHTDGINKDIALFDAIKEMAEPDAASVISSISHHDQYFLPMFALLDVVERGIHSVVESGVSLRSQTD